MKQLDSQSGFKETLNAVLLFLLVLAGFYGIYRFHHILFALFVAIIFGTMARPIYQWFINRGIHKNLVSGIMLVGLLMLSLCLMPVGLPLLRCLWGIFWASVPASCRLGSRTYRTLQL